MHLILPKSVFVHIPKTGGTWVRKALAEAGIPWSRTGFGPHVAYSTLEPIVEGRFTFAFVRHPITWYRSYWSFRMATLEKYEPTSFDEYLSPDFDEYVTANCTHRPGALAALYERYTGWPVRLSWVGHYERLAEGLIEALTLAGESFDPAAIRACAPSNVSPESFKSHANYREGTPELVLRAEAGVLSRYGYGSEPAVPAPPIAAVA